MATAPDTDVVAALTGAIGLTAGTNLFSGPVRAYTILEAGTVVVPHKAVFCLATGGPPPMSFVNGGSGTDYNWSVVQIRIRSDIGSTSDFADGQTLARAVRDRLHKAVVTGYIEIRVRESEPNYLAQDDDGHHEWSINLEMEHRR